MGSRSRVRPCRQGNGVSASQGRSGKWTELTFAADDPNLVVTVGATNGKTGKEGQLSYTNCKVVGNGSFGVVFAAKMLREFDAPSSLLSRA